MAEIKVGDYVRIGNGSLTWEVMSIAKATAVLKSGQTGRHRVEWLSKLIRHPYQKESA